MKKIGPGKNCILTLILSGNCLLISIAMPSKIQDFNPNVFSVKCLYSCCLSYEFPQSGLLNWRGVFARASEFGSFTIMFVMRALVKNGNGWHETPEQSFELSRKSIS